MLEFEDISTGHHDLLTSKFYSSVNVCSSPSTMDMLLTGDSFQEMLDLDIKSEIDTVLGFNNDFANLNFNFHDAPPLDLDDNPSELNMWFSGSNHSNSNFNIDFIGSEAAAMMVNPNSVMPLALVTVPPKSNSPTTVKSSPSQPQKSLTFPSVIKVSDVELKKPIGKTIKVSSPLNNKIIRNQDIKTNSHSLLNIKNAIQKQINSGNFNGISNVKVLSNNRKQQFNNNRHYIDDVKAYPKPAYSYSCLIAMALKNSRNGSLPVSEIYNFMCEHFPYFKTAPNGWKNSVRHNLSLNKCFEKIEKPAVSGAQRKGCLWAMNPAKISKMDDEVQKWSRKDPTAIRKAMIKPEHLEALERGELKYTCRTRSEDDADVDEDPGTEEEEDGSASDVEGSDVEVEETTENELELDTEFINVATIDEEGYDIEEVTETFYTTGGSPTIKIEMEVVDDELLESSYTPSRKRSRGILELDDSFSGSRLYHLQPPTRRKTAYLIKNE